MSAFLALTGCARLSESTRANKLPTPPPAKSKAVLAKDIVPYVPKTHMVLSWTDCGAQEPGVWYEVFSRSEISAQWTLYASLTNVQSISIPFTNAYAFFTIAAVNTNGVRTWLITTDCP